MSIQTPDWVKNAVFYQIFPDRFACSPQVPKPGHLDPWGAAPTYHGFQGGDLIGIVERLDYLDGLGVDALYLNPIFASTANHRYHTYDYFRVDPILGGNEALRTLIDAAHARGIRVILDGVFNHTSRGFFQFNHLLESGRESPYRDWFHVFNWPLNAYDEDRPANYAAWWGMHALPKLNTSHPEVREFLWRVGTYWLEQGIDGWRLDVPNEIDDDHFWREFRRRCRTVNSDCYLVGEFWGEAHRWLQGDQFDGQMNYMFARAVLGFLAGERLNREDVGRCGYQHVPTLSGYEFARELERLSNKLYRPDITLSNLNMLDSHDTPRLLTLANGDRQAVRLMVLTQMLAPGVPNIYYGTEIGLAGRHDPDCRRAFPWHDEASWDPDLRRDVGHYIRLRRRLPALRRGTFCVSFAHDKVVVFQRRYQGQTVLAAVNAGWSHLHLIPWGEEETETLTEQLAPAGSHLLPGQTVTLSGRSARVWINQARDAS